MKRLLPHRCGCWVTLFLALGTGSLSGAQRPVASDRVLNNTTKEAANSSRRPCLSIAQAASYPETEICLSAHVYNVVELADGTRFLDVCPPSTADADCGFTVVSLRSDREEVGDLRPLRNQDIHLRGMVRVTHGRMGIVVSHARQFKGGPEKFRPNPLLVHDLGTQSDRMPVRDPNLAPSGKHRSFMDRRNQENPYSDR